jgi:hypothetical protein
MAVKCRRERYHCMSRLVLIFMWVVHGFISSDPNMTSASWSFSPIPCALFAHRSHHKQWICVGRRQIHGFSVPEAVLAATMKGPPIHGPSKSLSTHNLLDWQTRLGSFRYGQNYKPQEWSILWVHWYQVWLINISHKKYPPVTTECPQCLGSL